LGALTAIGVGIAGVIAGWVANRVQATLAKREQQRQAAAAFRFELETNLLWVENALESLNYLRSEAWRKHGERRIRFIRQGPDPDDERGASEWHEKHGRDEAARLAASIRDLIALLDGTYPDVARNFKGVVSM
jgi:hypothetical protein